MRDRRKNPAAAPNRSEEAAGPPSGPPSGPPAGPPAGPRPASTWKLPDADIDPRAWNPPPYPPGSWPYPPEVWGCI